MTRVDTLKLYLARLASDVALEGKFVGVGSDKAEAAAKALLGGGASMLGALFEDIKQVAGDGHLAATGAVAGLASRAVENGIRVGMSKLGEALSVALDKDRRAQRAAGKAFMDAAKRIGR